MAIWRPNICANGQCVYEWTAGDNFNPIGPFRFTQVCGAHAGHPDDAARLAALKDENQSMSFGRAKLAELIDLKSAAGEYSGEDIAFVFDSKRQVTFTVPTAFRAAALAKRAQIAAALGAISKRIVLP